MLEELMVAGFGGQGVIMLGQMLAYAGLEEGKNVSWMPAYGPETRGGFANCTVMLGNEDIYSPATSSPTSLVIMNLPSLDKFEPMLRSGGFILVNESLVNRDVQRTDVKKLMIPATAIATELGNVKAANMVALGAYIGKTKLVKLETVISLLPKIFKGKEKLIPLNENAIKKGFEFAENN